MNCRIWTIKNKSECLYEWWYMHCHQVIVMQVQAVLLLLGGCEVPSSISSTTLPDAQDEKVLHMIPPN